MNREEAIRYVREMKDQIDLLRVQIQLKEQEDKACDHLEARYEILNQNYLMTIQMFNLTHDFFNEKI